MFPPGDRDNPFFVEAHQCGHGWMWIFPALFLLLLAAGLVWAILRTRTTQPPAAAAAPDVDPALAEARMRYARGELTREQFLEADADLRGAPPPAP
jgi:uncharacterized membrane protein